MTLVTGGASSSISQARIVAPTGSAITATATRVALRCPRAQLSDEWPMSWGANVTRSIIQYVPALKPVSGVPVTITAAISAICRPEVHKANVADVGDTSPYPAANQEVRPRSNCSD